MDTIAVKPPVHFSTLKQIARSPLHYLHAVMDTQQYQSRAMLIGIAAHALVLGEQPDSPIVVFDGERRGKAWIEFRREHEGATILNRQEHTEAMWIAAAVKATPVAMSMLEGAELEVTKEWEYLGRACSSRLDVVHPGYIADLKTTSCAEPVKFARHAIAMGYHAQLAFYNRAALRPPTAPAYVIAVESRKPHPVVVMRLTERALDYGDRLCRLWMERLLQCEAEGAWPGYVQGIVPLDVPEWDDQTTLTIDGEEIAL